MPAISTMVYPAPAYVRVETNWADTGQAVRAAVYRVDCLTGVRVPLRPYVSFSGDFMDTSCGQGIWWDTEPQLDRCVYYCTQAQDAAGNLATTAPSPVVADPFTRVVANAWGTAPTGQVWINQDGAAADYAVTGTEGSIANPTVGIPRRGILDTGATNVGVSATVRVTVLPTAGPLVYWLMARTENVGVVDNTYIAQMVLIQGTNDARIDLIKRVATVQTTLGSVTVGTHAAGDRWMGKLETWGSQIRTKMWKSIDPEPATWTITATDTSLGVGTFAGLMSRREAGNTNNYTAFFDDFTVYDPCADNLILEACSDDVVVPSSGDFRLGDPVRPCNDVTLLFDAPIDPDCVPTQGVFFGSMADETFAANSGAFVPVNSEFPIVANRTRMAPVSTLTVASKTFADRDAVRRLNKPGSPLLLRGPAEYGIADRYMAVGDITETRPVSDHRVTPRVIGLPHAQVARPSGPSQGVCGTRVQDLCDIYPTWNAIVAAGLTYADLLRGKASNDTPIPDTVERTWAQVNALYGSWNAELAANADWDTLREGV